MGNQSDKRDIKKYTDANREAWNEATLIHQKARLKKKIDYKKEFSQKGYSTLDEYATAKLKEIGLEGKRVAQVCCNNGQETLSLVNLGAKSAVGFDISDEAIKEAKGLAEISGLNCEFVRADVYDIGEEYFDSFDLIFITIGALGWMPDLFKYFSIVSKMLHTGGHLMIYEHHPFCYLLAMNDEEEFVPNDPLKIVYSYFRTEPWVGNDGIDYIGGTKYEAKTSYDFTHTLTKVINSIAGNGIRIKEFIEYGHDISMGFPEHEKEGKVPLSYILIGVKE